MNETLLVLKSITQALEQAGIPYMLSGSMAMNYYAQPRMTRDIDLIVAIQIADVPRLAAELGEDYYFDEQTAEAAIADERLFNLLHYPSLLKIDCVVRKSLPYRTEEFSRRRRVDFAGFPVWIVSAEDLVLSKLYWLRESRSEMQFRDVRNLINAVPSLDGIYLRHWADHLGIRPLLEEVMTQHE